MDTCKICKAVITKDKVSCDGICDNHFHSTCLKRGSKFFPSFTCSECSEIKPCHILRFLRGTNEDVGSLSASQSFIARTVRDMSAKWATFENLSDDYGLLNGKIDKIGDLAATTLENSLSVLRKVSEVSTRCSSISVSVDELHALVSGGGLPSFLGADKVEAVVGDISRGIRKVEGDIRSFSLAVGENAKTIESVVQEVKKLVSDKRVGALNKFSPKGGKANPKRHDRSKHTVVKSKSSSITTSSSVSCPLGESHPGPEISTSKVITPMSVPDPVTVSRGVKDGEVVPPSNSNNNTISTNDGAAGPPCVPGVSDSVPEPADASTVSNGSNDDVITLSVVPRPKPIFISRLTPDTTCGAVLRFIRSKGIDTSPISCKRISSPSKPYASFLLSAPVHDADILLNSNFWPNDVFCKIFKPKSRRLINVDNVVSPISKNGVHSPSTIRM